MNDLNFSFQLQTEAQLSVSQNPDDVESDDYVDPTQLLLFNDQAPSNDNPFGFGPNSGFRITAGTLPAGVTLTPQGLISGIPTETGAFNITLEYTDPLGRKLTADRTVLITASPFAANSTSFVKVTTSNDNNVRDDDISFREAVLLANGTLTVNDLSDDPDLNNGIPEGERRHVTGNPAAGECTIFHNVTQININSTLTLTATSAHIDLGTTTVLNISASPGLVIAGNENVMQEFNIQSTSPGTTILVSGNSNFVGVQGRAINPALFTLTGNGSGTGIEVTGVGNVIGAGVVNNFATAVHVRGGVANIISGIRLINSTDGLLMNEQSLINLIEESSFGHYYDTSDVNRLAINAPNSNYGIRLEGASESNEFTSCEIAGNGSGGILVTGVGTNKNAFNTVRSGDDVDARGISLRIANPNNGPGITISGGAQANSINDSFIGENLGHGILITGNGTDLNEISQTGDDLTKFETGTTGPYDAVRIEGGASRNILAVNIRECPANGVTISGSGTDNNTINYMVEGLDTAFPRTNKSFILNCTGAGILIQDGAKDNQIGVNTPGTFGLGPDIQDCAVAVRITGAGTDGNSMVTGNIRRITGHGIEITNGASANMIEGGISIGSCGGSAIYVAGTGTSNNAIHDLPFLIDTNIGNPGNTRYAIEIANGASENYINNVTIQRHVMGGILIDGSHDNVISGSSISGVFFGDPTGTGEGVAISNGATGNTIDANTISRNGLNGIVIQGATTTENCILGNLVFGNNQDGVIISNAPGNMLGAPESGNAIGQNGGVGICITGSAATNNTIQSNGVGRAHPSFTSGNGSHGIVVKDTANGNFIGGIRPIAYDSRGDRVRLAPDSENMGAGNTILGNNGDGIHIDGVSNTFIGGNLIGGPTINGVVLANTGNGVAIIGGATNTRVGNIRDDKRRNVGYSNYITLNGGAGILVDGAGSIGNRLIQNELVGNLGGRILLTNGANGGVQPPTLTESNLKLSGTVSEIGVLEIYLFGYYANDLLTTKI